MKTLLHNLADLGLNIYLELIQKPSQDIKLEEMAKDFSPAFFKKYQPQNYKFVKTLDNERFYVFSKPENKHAKSIIYDTQYNEIQLGWLNEKGKEGIKIYGPSDFLFVNKKTNRTMRVKGQYVPKKTSIYEILRNQDGIKELALKENWRKRLNEGPEVFKNYKPIITKDFPNKLVDDSSHIDYNKLSVEEIQRYCSSEQTWGLYYLPNSLLNNGLLSYIEKSNEQLIKRLNQLNANQDVVFEAIEDYKDIKITNEENKTRFIITTIPSHQFVIAIRGTQIAILDNGGLTNEKKIKIFNALQKNSSEKNSLYLKTTYTSGLQGPIRGDCVAQAQALLFKIFREVNGYSYDDLITWANDGQPQTSKPKSSKKCDPLLTSEFSEFEGLVEYLNTKAKDLNPQKVLAFEALLNELCLGRDLDKKGKLNILYHHKKEQDKYLIGVAFENHYANPDYLSEDPPSLERLAWQMRKNQQAQEKVSFISPIQKTRL